VGSPSDAATGSPRDYLELVRLLDLYPADTLEEQVRELQEHRASVLAALRAPDPPVPTSTSIRLRACQHEAVELCEQALDTLNAPYDADGEADEA
jgi:hypothetical protein